MREHRYERGALLLLAIAVWPALARAQEANEVTPPVAVSGTDVPYPEGATGEASVELELVVETDGSVASAQVVEGAEPFADAARSAALGWRFEPARRGDVPIAAKIRARVDFHPLPSAAPAPEPAAAPAPSATGSEPAPSEPPPREVMIRGQRREVGQTTLSASEVRAMPGAFGDPFRAIEALPGVTPIFSGFPYFYVRGAPPNNNGYFFDGIPLPVLFHVGIGEGVIHPGLVDRIDFYPSAAPASYGRVAGAVIAAQSREPSSVMHGEANLRLFDAGALFEAPFADGRGSALVAGRYGYPGLVLRAVTSDLRLDYWDYQARASYRVGDHDTLGIFAFGSHDRLATLESDKLVEQFASEFHRVDLRYDHAGSEGRVRIAATLGYDYRGGVESSDGGPRPYIRDPSAAVRLEFDQRIAEPVRLRGGADIRFDSFSLKQAASDPSAAIVPSGADPPPDNLSAGAHADAVVRVAPRVEIVPGVRFDVFASSRPNAAGSELQTRRIVPALDPRLAARVSLADNVAWLSSLGLAHQYPVLRVGTAPSPLVSVPGFPTGDKRLQSAAQASQGLELALPAEIVVTGTGFLSRLWGLTDLTAPCYQLMSAMRMGAIGELPQEPFVCPDDKPVTGVAYGFELLVRRAFSKRLSGWLAYTLSRATRKAHFVTPSGGDAVANVPSETDHTHVLNAALAYDFGAGFRAGSRFMFYTGRPYSELAGSVPVAPYNSRRFPPFYRVDVRFEKRWQLARDAAIALVIEGQNVTLSKERFGLDCRGELQKSETTLTESTRCKAGTFGPLTIPSIGVEAFF